MATLFEISIRPIQNDQDAAHAADFASLHFEGYEPESRLQWISEKFLPRLLDGSAFGLLVYFDKRTVIGNSLMYVSPGENTGELKYFRVADLYTGQGIGKLLWRQSEIAMANALRLSPDQTGTLKLDTRETNLGARRFFRSCGCNEVGRAALYERNVIDVMYEKTIQASAK